MGQLKRYENVKIADLTPYENNLDGYGYDISFTGFDLNDFDVEQDDIEFDDDIGEAPQLPTEAKSKTGEKAIKIN